MMMPKMKKVRLFFTTGTLPKKNPPNTKKLIQKTLPNALNAMK